MKKVMFIAAMAIASIAAAQPARIGITSSAPDINQLARVPYEKWVKMQKPGEVTIWAMLFESSPGGVVDAMMKTVDIRREYGIEDEVPYIDESFGMSAFDTKSDNMFRDVHISLSVDYCRYDRGWIFYDNGKKYALRTTLQKDLYTIFIIPLNK